MLVCCRYLHERHVSLLSCTCNRSPNEFTANMTVAHCSSGEAAETARAAVEAWYVVLLVLFASVDTVLT